MSDVELTLEFISAWFWHLQSIIFLCSSLVILFSGDGVGNNVLFAAFMFGFFVSELRSYSKVRRFRQIDGNE